MTSLHTPRAALVVRGSCLLLLALGCACSDNGPTASAPPGTGFTGGTSPNGSGGTGGGDAGTGGTVSVPLTRCESVVASSEPGEGFVNTSTQSPSDFSVTRVLQGYGDDCGEPKVVIELSDGRCPDGDGHQLRLEFDAAAIAAGEVPNGELDVLVAHADGQLDIQYKRPENLENPGTYGTCNVGTGTVALTEAPQVTRNAVYEGSYQLSLGPCGGTDGPTQLVVGTFSARLATDLTLHCPDF